MIRRKALLIGYSGEGKDYLPGVRKDLSNVHRYLQSPRGGGWLPEEIEVLQGPSRAQLIRKVSKCTADYLLVYFAGHGLAESAVEWTGGHYEVVNNRFLEINGEEMVRDMDLLNLQVMRQLVICDCCRCRPGATIGGIPETLAEWSFDVEEFYAARGVFDQYITLSPAGAIVVHGAQDGQPSYDSKDGGRFTLTLLGGALDWRTGSVLSPIRIESLVDYTAAVLGDTRRAQLPEIVYHRGNLRVPFGMDTPWPWGGAEEGVAPGTMDRSLVQPASMPDPAKAWLVVGGLLAGALWLATRE